MNDRRSSALAIAVTAFACVALVGCAPNPEPTPTPQATFASEEEAFAAAEDVYRAYVAALNEVDTAIPMTFEPLFELSSGEFNASDRENFSMLHSENLTLTGTTKLEKFEGVRSAPPFETVVAVICLDVGDTDVIDESGASHVAESRPDQYSMELLFLRTDGTLLIDRAARLPDGATCD